MTVKYVPNYFLCAFSTLAEPSAVSVVMDDPCAKPLHTIPLSSSLRLTRRTFTVCVSPLFGSMGEQIIEWIEMNRLLGVDFFVFYNYSIPEMDMKILSYYVKRGIAEVNLWNLPLKEDSIHYNGQMAAINDCIFRHRDDTDFIAIINVDEVIVPRYNADKTWQDMLKRLPKASSFIFKSVLYTAQRGNTSEKNDLDRRMKYKLDILNKLGRTFNAVGRFKMILNPRAIDIAGIYFVHEHAVGHSVAVSENIGLVHHYRLKKDTGHVPRMITDKTVLKYRGRLPKNTQKVWETIL